jgi:hypothetical protein
VNAFAVVLAALPILALAQGQADIDRAVIERDRQSAEFANPELRGFHQRQDSTHRPVRPDERAAQTRERDAEELAEKPVPAAPAPDYSPLPLPGGPTHGVDPIPVQGRGR